LSDCGQGPGLSGGSARTAELERIKAGARAVGVGSDVAIPEGVVNKRLGVPPPANATTIAARIAVIIVAVVFIFSSPSFMLALFVPVSLLFITPFRFFLLSQSHFLDLRASLTPSTHSGTLFQRLRQYPAFVRIVITS